MHNEHRTIMALDITDLEHIRDKRALQAERGDAPQESVLSSDGLRYKVKKTGSPFGPSQMASGAATMSCFKCGRHRPNTELISKHILGKNQRICPDNCKR